MARRTVRPFCLAGHCIIRGRHTEDCEGDCRGCLPRLAADGLRLCDLHARALGEDAMILVPRYSDLGLVLTGGQALGDLVTSSPDPNMSINDRAAELRKNIRQALAAVCGLVARERGISPPPTYRFGLEYLPKGVQGPKRLYRYPLNTMVASAAYVGLHREWIAAHQRAGEISVLLHDLAHGETYRVAYPSGGRSYAVRTPDGFALCPETVDGKPCEGTLWTVMRRTDALLPAELVCNAETEQHVIPFADWLRQARRLRARAGVPDVEPTPIPVQRGRTVTLHGGPLDGQTIRVTANPPPACMALSAVVVGGAETRQAVAYTRRDNDTYDYIGDTT